MDTQDRRAIEELFEKLAAVEKRSGPRDAEAEAFIRAAIARQAAAPYYMAQTIIVQEEALRVAKERIEELEGQSQREDRGFLSGILGGGRERSEPRDQDRRQPQGARPWGAPAGGGFLAGAAQTAMGVAGGVLLGNLLANTFFGHGAFGDAASGASADTANNDTSADNAATEQTDATSDSDFEDANFDGGDFGDFDAGGFDV